MQLREINGWTLERRKEEERGGSYLHTHEEVLEITCLSRDPRSPGLPHVYADSFPLSLLLFSSPESIPKP
jgi:hypothetical protein